MCVRVSVCVCVRVRVHACAHHGSDEVHLLHLPHTLLDLISVVSGEPLLSVLHTRNLFQIQICSDASAEQMIDSTKLKPNMVAST